MPQLQILGRQEEPMSQTIREGTAGIMDTIQKKQAMELTKQQIAIQMKSAQDEHTKVSLQAQKQLADMVAAIADKKLRGPLAAITLEHGIKSLKDIGFSDSEATKIFGDLAKKYEGNYQAIVDAIEPSPEAQKAQAETSKIQAQADQMKDPGAYMRSMMSGLQGGQPAEGETGNQARSGAMITGGTFPGPGGEGSVTWTDPTAETTKPTADQLNYLKQMSAVKASVGSLIDLADKLPTGRMGQIGMLGAQASGGENLLGFEANAVQYLDDLPGTAVGFYKNVIGDNRVSDADAQTRALGFFWRPGQSEKVRKQKHEYIRAMMDARELALKQGTYQVDEYGQLITPMSTIKKIADKLIKQDAGATTYEGYTIEELP